MTEEETVKRILIPLNIIALAKNSLRGKVRLQKLVFLVQEKSRGIVNFEFEPAPLGPLSDIVNHTISEMIELGWIEETIDKTPSGNDVICYNVTKSGSEFLKYGLESGKLPTHIQDGIKSVFQEYGEMPYVKLLDYVHNEFPDYHIKDIKF